MDSAFDEFGNWIEPQQQSDDVHDSPTFSSASSPSSNSNNTSNLTATATATATQNSSDSTELQTQSSAVPESPQVVYQFHEHDAQDSQQSLFPVAPSSTNFFSQHQPKQTDNSAIGPPCTWSWSFLLELLKAQDSPALFSRQVCVLGSLSSGKTTLVDTLIAATHVPPVSASFTQTRADEQDRQLSIKAMPITLLVSSSARIVPVGAVKANKSHVLHVMDSPGHIELMEEAMLAIRATDACLLCVDCAEGVTFGTERHLNAAINAGSRVILVLTKLDRLILELRLPPDDAYYKMLNVITHIDGLARNFGYSMPISPLHGNVLFSSALTPYVFTLHSMACIYEQRCTIDKFARPAFNALAFASKLWGDQYQQPDGTFVKQPKGAHLRTRTFVQFVLEPLWKIYAHTLGYNELDTTFDALLRELQVKMSRRQLRANASQVMHNVLREFFSINIECLVDALVTHAPAPLEAARIKWQQLVPAAFVDEQFSARREALQQFRSAFLACDPTQQLIADVIKLYPRAVEQQDESEGSNVFDAFCRVYSGTLTVGQQILVLNNVMTSSFPHANATNSNPVQRTITKLWLFQSRYRVPVQSIAAGHWALIQGVDASLGADTATLLGTQQDEHSFHLRPFEIPWPSCVRLFLQPHRASELPTLVAGLRAVHLSYPSCSFHVSDTGQYTIQAPGEFYLDCALHDLRTLFTNQLELRLSEPSVEFHESLLASSTSPTRQTTPNGLTELLITVEPLSALLLQALEANEFDFSTHKGSLAAQHLLHSRFGWDQLASRSVLACSPLSHPLNLLCNATLPNEVDATLLASITSSLIHGFLMAMREGPLCQEPLRGVKVTLLHARISPRPQDRQANQIILCMRQACSQAILGSRPCLMEPYYLAVIQAPSECINAITTLLRRRRGQIMSSHAIVGTPLHSYRAMLPVIDSFGFQVDVRVATQGAAFVVSVHSHYQLVPGDPLDESIVIRPLEPAPTPHLARDFVLKTRKRKGSSVG